MANQKKSGVGGKSAKPAADAIDLIQLEERRQAVRQPTFKAGVVIGENGGETDCVVRNVSDSGCLIKIENANALPPEVLIRIDLGKPARRAEIVWRSTSLAGARFIREPS